MNQAHEKADPSMLASGLGPQAEYHLLRTPHVPGTNPGGINKSACGKRELHVGGCLEMMRVVNREMKRDRE